MVQSGSGTGYVFAVVNLAATTLAVSVAAVFAQIFRSRGMPRSGSLYLFGAMLCAYVAVYLGLGRLIVLVLRRYLHFGLLLPFLVHVLLVLAGLGLPVFVQAWGNGFPGLDEYTALQVPNWAWTLSEASGAGWGPTPWRCSWCSAGVGRVGDQPGRGRPRSRAGTAGDAAAGGAGRAGEASRAGAGAAGDRQPVG